MANITANEYVVYNALLNAGADKPNLYQILIDGKPGVLGNLGLKDSFWGRGNIKRAISLSQPATRLMQDSMRMVSLADGPIAGSYLPSPGRLSGTCFTPCMSRCPKRKARQQPTIIAHQPVMSTILYLANLPRIDAKESRDPEKRAAKSFWRTCREVCGLRGGTLVGQGNIATPSQGHLTYRRGFLRGCIFS